jgi:hypothetical protein
MAKESMVDSIAVAGPYRKTPRHESRRILPWLKLRCDKPVFAKTTPDKRPAWQVMKGVRQKVGK